MTLTVTAQPLFSSVEGIAYRAYPAEIAPICAVRLADLERIALRIQDARQGDSPSGQKSGASAKPKTLDLGERAA